MQFSTTRLFSSHLVRAWAILAIATVGPVALTAQVSTSSLSRFSDRSTVDGASSTLIRNDAGITMTIITSDLVPGDAYTIWWVIFNNPEYCAIPGACAGGDLAPRGGDPAIQSSVAYGTGHVVSGTGVAGFAAHRVPGDMTGVRFGPGLISPKKAEVHLVVRTHGQPIPGMVDEQIGSLNGGCPPNTCEDHQFAIHIPGSDPISQSLRSIQDSADSLEAKVDAIKSLEDRIARALSIKP